MKWRSTDERNDLEIVPYPAVPLEDVYEPHSPLRGLTSRHTQDLTVIFGGICAASWYLSTLVLGTRAASDTGLVVAAAISSALVGMGTIYQLAKRRFSTVDVFSSEILARLRILSADSSVDALIKFTDPEHIADFVHRPPDKRLDRYSVIEPSPEHQFENFYRRSQDLGSLTPEVVDHVTDFYSFHAAARDQLRDLVSVIQNFPDRIDEINTQVVNVMFMIDLMAFSGFRALDALIETKTHKWHSWQIALSVGTKANSFLTQSILPSDKRYPEITNRRAKYALYTKTLRSKFRKYVRNELVRKGLAQKSAEYF